MKIAQINVLCGSGSTGKICCQISQLISNEDIENIVYYSIKHSNLENSDRFTNNFYRRCQSIKSYIIGNYGFNSILSTRRLVKKLKKLNPDIIQLHNIHSNDINLKILLYYIKKYNIKVFYTFHDCWAFTGYCTYFTMAECDRWKSKCYSCPQRKQYSWFFDKSEQLYNKKRDLFKDLDLTIITPSEWLADLVNQSFLKEYPVKVINNGIDLSVFKPTPSDFKERYNLENKFIVLGVAFGWGVRKGLDVFIELSKKLPENYQIVLVGTNDSTDKQLPDNIISIHKTNNQTELAEMYSSADVFFNPTREDNYPTVNMEAIACGCPVITFKTGGSPEMITESTGIVLEENTVDEGYNSIVDVCENHRFKREDCVEHAKSFDMNDRFKEYMELYKGIHEKERTVK